MAAPAHAHDALVLGALDYGERDRIVRLLTPELGRVSALARGARGSQRRFAGAVDLGNRVQAMLRPGRGELWHLQEAELVSARLHLRDDLLAMALCAYGCELVGALAREHHPEPRLFGLLEVFLTVLDAATAPPAGLFRAGLEIKALNLAGLAPVLDRCVRCGQPLAEPCAFSADGGGGLHAGCGAGEPVSLDLLASLEHARRTRLVELLDQPMPEGPAWLLARFAEHHLGRGLKSRRWLETVG
ncbi:MAG: DNA repair protein RecO [Pseudomonadota bacterium]